MQNGTVTLRFVLRIALAVSFALVIPLMSSAQIASGAYQGSNKSRDRVLVFVHGIHGSNAGTWKASSGAYWPDVVDKDAKFASSDVFVAGFPSPFTNNKNDIPKIADALYQLLTKQQVFSSHKQIIFVCHSLGGLIVKEMLLSNPSEAPKVPFIVFYGTPSAGAFVAQFLSFFSGDPLLEAMSNSGDNQYLLGLEQRWRTANLPIHRYCAYEMKKMVPNNLSGIVTTNVSTFKQKLLQLVDGVYIVNPYSATYGCDTTVPFTGIPENHIGIVKPSGPQHPSYLLLLSYFRNGPVIAGPSVQIVKYSEPICAFYGESESGGIAWSKGETCPIKNFAQLDRDYRQTTFNCCGGGASSNMTIADIPPGIELLVDGGHYWSIPNAKLDGEKYFLTIYCGPEGKPGPGCNVKVKIIGHYKIAQTVNAKSSIK